MKYTCVQYSCLALGLCMLSVVCVLLSGLFTFPGLMSDPSVLGATSDTAWFGKHVPMRRTAGDGRAPGMRGPLRVDVDAVPGTRPGSRPWIRAYGQVSLERPGRRTCAHTYAHIPIRMD